jgi:hypothetical protein
MPPTTWPPLTPEAKARAELVTLIEDTVRAVLVAELVPAVEYIIARRAGNAA